jgi:DNA-binding transcriptional MerR regulator
MNTKNSNTNPAEKFRYSIDDITALHGMNEWTIRMWANRFKILEHIYDANDNIRFTPKAVELIGIIRDLTEKKMKLADISEYLESIHRGE